MDENDVRSFANEIISGRKLTEERTREILLCRDEKGISNIFSAARLVREHFFSRNVFLYSFVYFSTYCKNECAFCYYNKKNNIKRYRVSREELKETAKQISKEGVHMIDLTMGEDPYFIENPENLSDYIKIAKENSNLPVMISPGAVSLEFLPKMKESGADFLALYQETYDEKLYSNLRCGQSFEYRKEVRKKAKECGICIEDGILTGIGNDYDEEVESIVKSIKCMKEQSPDQVRAMTFEPQPGTPLEKRTQMSDLIELKTIAALRFSFPDRLIPASLDVAGIKGMVDRLNAGANVVTSIISKDSTLEGVVNFDKDVELSERMRDAKSVTLQLEKMGLKKAEQSEFCRYIEKRKAN
ncbi:MAG: methylornithine synthase PylB [Methanosarcinaceae archaeon]|nr:methylornithine synthase PylB [Methanosarcinaceae archaeon]